MKMGRPLKSTQEELANVAVHGTRLTTGQPHLPAPCPAMQQADAASLKGGRRTGAELPRLATGEALQDARRQLALCGGQRLRVPSR